MDKNQWEKAREILPAVRNLPLSERTEYIERACAGDEGLRHALEALLAANLDRVAFLEDPPLRLFDSPPSMEGRQLGAYRIVRELGQGGMGAVYLAVRADEAFEGQVAIKVLRPGGSSREFEWRFRQEIQILANLNHPNIAKLFEVGRTDEGNPYFIMEYVEGIPISRFCFEQNLALLERLRLFQKVCSAVQYAHQNLIVHRDLKPSNILVTPQGEPKLLDFGIAKLLPPEDSPDPATVTEFRFFTPDYASPEQISGRHITTASDVYSLGVVLYELLTRRRPYRVKDRTPEEIRQIICSEEPMFPSVIAITETRERFHDAESHKDQERISRTFGRQIQGDLDKIVLMALRKEPSRRYHSVEQFANDIELHLSGFPVFAQGDSWKYRAAKFLQRNRLASALATAVILLSLGFGTLMVFQQRQTERERDRAGQVSDFMKNVFLLADPTSAKASEISATELLERSAHLLLVDKTKDPRIRAELLNTLSTIYTHLGLYEAALPLAEEALRIVRAGHGSKEDLGSMLNDLAIIHHHQGNQARAEIMYHDALEFLQASVGPTDPKIAEGLNNLAALLLEMGKYDESERLFRQSLDMRRALFAGGSPEVIESINNLAAVLTKQGRLAEAETLFRETLRLKKHLHKSAHPDLGTAYHNLGWISSEQRKYEEAKKYYLLGLQQDRAVYDWDHPSAAKTLGNLANSYVELGEYDQAVKAAQEALEIYRRRFGERSKLTAQGLFMLAKVRFLRRELHQAEATAQKALDIRRATLRQNHPDIAYSLSLLGDILEEEGELASAEKCHRESLEVRKANKKTDHPDLVKGLERLGLFLIRQNRAQEAEPLFGEALSMASRLYEKTHPDIADLEKALASAICTRPDRAKEGESLAAQAADKLQAAFPPGHWRAADAEGVWGKCLALQNRFAEAEPHLQKAVIDLTRARGQSAPMTQRAIRRLVKLYEDWGEPAEAAKYRALLTSP